MSVVRGFVVIVYAIAFFVALWSSSTVWPLIELGGANVEAIVIFTLLVAFCGVLISIFVYIESKKATFVWIVCIFRKTCIVSVR